MARVTSFILLLATCILLVASIKEVVGDVVFDVDGDPVTAGGRYYAVSVIWGAGGGGLSIGKRDGTLTVKQESSGWSNGSPLYFLPWLTKEGLITESKSLTISFGSIEAPNFWKLTRSNGKGYVTISINNGSLATYNGNSLFQLKSDPLVPGISVYKILYCIDEPTDCSDLGISGPNRWLELSAERTLLLRFIKAENTTKELEELI